MKLYALLLMLFLAVPFTAAAQKSGLINSGELIKEGAKLHDSSAYKQALLTYNKVSRSDTNYVRVLSEKAITCEADSQFKQAINYCREALSLKEQREYEPGLYNTYGNSLSDIKEYEQAIKVFDAGIAKYPQYALFYFNKGVVRMLQERPAEAELLFQKTLLVNPYMYSAHYQLGLAALQQGKLIPAFLSCVGYLLVSPQGKYFSNAINMLSSISKSTDEILGLKNKRKETPDANYQTVEEIVLSKIALDKQYKPIIALDDMLSRQIQVVFEKLEYDEKDKDFWIQYYLPYYKQVYQNGKFELFINHSFSNAKVAAVQEYNKKNKKELEAFVNGAADYFNQIRATHELSYAKRDTLSNKYVYSNGKLLGKGVLINNDKTLVGHWDFYYDAGNIKGRGNYNATGGREGTWNFYNYIGQVKSIENYKNGKLEGEQNYYYDNGNLSAHESYVNGLAEGLITTYYLAGNKKLTVNYTHDKKNGEEVTYYANGNLKAIYGYTNGELNGTAKEYYKRGQLKTAGQNISGKTEGPYKTYYESGKLSTDLHLVKGKVEGEWIAYYESGKIKEKRNYVNDMEDGLHQEYYENGQLSASYMVKKAKANSEAVFYHKDGKVYSKYLYDNGTLQAVKYFDPAEKQIYASEIKDGLIDVFSYTPDGIKKAHLTYDGKGNFTGPDTVFYPSGKISQICAYKNGELNGPVINYYLNGKKKSEINMTDGKEDGYYEGFYVNGQIEAEGWIKNGDYQGPWVYHDIHGKLSSTAYYLDSELNGYKEQYEPDGQKTAEEKYNNGVLESLTQYDEKGNTIAIDSFPKGSGKYTLLYPDKKVMAQTSYVNGNYSGGYKTFYFDGSVESSFFYKNGLLDSTYTSYYYGGIKHSQGRYHLGNRDGKWNRYDEDGKLSSVTNYVNDQMNGERIYYNPDGTKDFVATYKDDMLDGTTQKYDPDGTLAYQAIFEEDKIKAYTYIGKDGKLLPFIPVAVSNGQFKAFYPNGKVSRECVYSDGEKNGQMTIYYNNGQVRSVDNEVYGITEGVSKEFYANGKLESEYPYLSDNLEGIGKEYYKSGTLKKEIAYANGTNHGPTKLYDENGRLAKTLLYNYGKLIAVKNEK